MSKNSDSKLSGNFGVQSDSFGDSASLDNDLSTTTKESDHIPSIIDAPLYEESEASSSCTSYCNAIMPTWSSFIFVFTYAFN